MLLLMHQATRESSCVGCRLYKWTSTLVTYVILHDFTGAKVFLHYSQLVSSFSGKGLGRGGFINQERCSTSERISMVQLPIFWGSDISFYTAFSKVWLVPYIAYICLFNSFDWPLLTLGHPLTQLCILIGWSGITFVPPTKWHVSTCGARASRTRLRSLRQLYMNNMHCFDCPPKMFHISFFAFRYE